MMGSCSLWLLLVILLPLVRIAPAYYDHRVTFLVAIKNNESGLEVHTHFPENHGYEGSGSQPELESKMHFIPNRSLSSECGDQYFRCQHLLVEPLNTASGDVNIIFIPLENGVLLLKYWYDSNNMTIESSSFIVNSSNCSPTVFYKIDSTIYTVCVSSYSGYFAVYEVQLSGSVIENTTLMGPLTEINGSFTSSNFTNFVLIEHEVYFAVDNIIAVMNILNSTQMQIYSESPAECTQIHKLVSAKSTENQQVLLAYCTDTYFYFCITQRDWCERRLFSSEGIPYLCPDNNYRATLFNNTLQLSGRSFITEHNLYKH